MNSTDAFSQLVHELSKLPGVGEKSATRMAYSLISADVERVSLLAKALTDAKEKVKLCNSCLTYTENDICEICVDPSRQHHLICVVERPSDVRAIEMSGKYRGLYHVLHGLLSPVDGVGPDQIRLKELLQRISSEVTQRENAEIILALNPSVEGEATSLYISRLAKPFTVKVSKIAYGLPMGGSIEYADRGTIGRALDNRTNCN